MIFLQACFCIGFIYFFKENVTLIYRLPLNKSAYICILNKTLNTYFTLKTLTRETVCWNIISL